VQRTLYDADHDSYREMVREFVAREVEPNVARWDADRLIDRQVWRAAGKQGVIGLAVPEELGGAGQPDMRYRLVVGEELATVGAAALQSGFGVQEDIVVPYLRHLGTPEQQRRWLPGMAAGETIAAIAMTEPGAGSDLRGLRTTAVRDGDEWVINGQKTFISSGITADLVVVAARTDPDAGAKSPGRGGGGSVLSLFVVERGTPGFRRGRKLDKIGLHAQDTAELFFDDARVPAGNLLGERGHGFAYLMANLPVERLGIAITAITVSDAVLAETTRYCFDRTAFGQPIGDFQHTRFTLAEMATELDVTRAYVDNAITAFNAGTLTAVDAAKVKWWTTELQKRVVDRCLQLHGGYGYMMEYPVGRAYIDARVQTIYGGTTEIMKEIIGRDIAKSARHT
jgi:long-chain-acyl-CoA dehydrogenase